MSTKTPTSKPDAKSATAQAVPAKAPVAKATTAAASAPAPVPAKAAAPAKSADPVAAPAPAKPVIPAAAKPAAAPVKPAAPAAAPSVVAAKPAVSAAPAPAPAPVAATPVPVPAAAKPAMPTPTPAPMPAAAPVPKAAKVAAKTSTQTSPAIKQQQVEKANPAMQQFEKAIPAMMKGYDEFTAMNQATVDAFMKAGNLLVKGYEDIGKEYFKFAQASAEAGAEAAKSMMSAKTLKEVVDVQSGYARASFDTLVAESTKLNEMTVKVANEAIQPIQTQFNKTMERVLKVSAAA